MEIYKKVEPFHQPLWSIEVLLFLLVASMWVIGLITEYNSLSIVCFALAQVLVGWMGHSGAHSRNKTLNIFGRVEASLLGGFSIEWWSPKHNMHHMFTNISKYDEDIQHEYKVYFYPFLYLKWRFDSLVSAIKSKNYVPPFLPRSTPPSSSSTTHLFTSSPIALSTSSSANSSLASTRPTC